MLEETTIIMGLLVVMCLSFCDSTPERGQLLQSLWMVELL